jgi:hypothetical protein
MSEKDPCGKCELVKKACPGIETTGPPKWRKIPARYKVSGWPCQACARTERRKRVRLDKALAWIAQQPCRAEAEGADGKHITCRETGACATEWCLPCYAVGAGLELKGE